MRTEAEKIARRAYYQAHKDEINAKRKAYREANKDRINAQKRAYNEAHRETVRAQKRKTNAKYRAAHKAEITQRNNLYKKGKGREKDYLYRMRKRLVPKWIGICAEGPKAIQSYLDRSRAKARFHFVEWFTKERASLGLLQWKIRGQYGVFRIVPNFGI